MAPSCPPLVSLCPYMQSDKCPSAVILSILHRVPDQTFGCLLLLVLLSGMLSQLRMMFLAQFL